MSAESNMVRPASRQTSTRRVASDTSLPPQALKNSPLPPKVPVPNVRTGTLKPELPSCRKSMNAPGRVILSYGDDRQVHYNLRDGYVYLPPIQLSMTKINKLAV